MMTNRMSRLRMGAPLGALLVSACVSSVVPPRQPLPRAQPRPSAYVPPVAKPDPLGVIGSDSRGLERLFGRPRLDIRDPAVRKLQFTDGQCILDAYLYPPRPRKEPVTTFAEARTADGDAMDWTVCAAQLKRR